MVIGINCGHTVSGTVGAGAIGYLNESDETRAVGKALMRMLRNVGCTVVDCTNDRASTVSENLSEICRLANAQFLDAFISIHFNAGGGTGAEAYTYDASDRAYASKMLDALYDLGFKNRGIKNGSKLYVVRNTNAPACLLEVCFVDNKEDAELYRKLGAEVIAAALCRAITGSYPDGEEDLSVSQYEELKSMINELSDKVDRLESPMIYNYIDDNMPEWARSTVRKLVDMGALKGDGDGLGLTDDMLRLLVINDRAGLYQ